MKRGICIAAMVLVAICVCACGRQNQNTKKSDKPVTTSGMAEETASGQAVEEKQGISNARAFAMAEELLKDMTLEEKIGQMFMVHLSGLDDSHTADGNQYTVTPKMRQMLKKYNIGGIYLTVNNLSSARQVKKLIKGLQASASGGALNIAVEEEGGGEHSLSAQTGLFQEADSVTPAQMGQNLTSEQVHAKCMKIAEELAEFGINLNLAPVADIASEKNEAYGMRCLGSEQRTVKTMIENFVTGMQDGGVGTTLKYFPGMGNVPGDSSVALLENTDSLMTLRNINFALYSAGIKAGADAVMMSSISVNKVTVEKIPAFLSQDIVTKILREELGFDGVIMTPFLDDPIIKEKFTPEFVAVEAVKAGCDMLILPEQWKESYHALVRAVERGDIDEKVINTAAGRILQNKIRRGILVLENKES